MSATLLGDATRGGELLLVLPGAVLDGRGAVLERIALTRPVLLIGYRRLGGMNDLVDAIARLLADLGHTTADVLGSSFGGWVAQCLAERHPERVRRLILSHAFALRPGDAARFRVALAIWPRIPRAVLSALFRLRVRKALAPVRRHSEAVYASALAQAYAALEGDAGRQAVVDQTTCMLDSLTTRRATRECGTTIRPVLILESSDDPLVPRAARAHLRSRYPHAVVHCFTGSGHVSALAEPQAFAEALERFLDRERS